MFEEPPSPLRAEVSKQGNTAVIRFRGPAHTLESGFIVSCLDELAEKGARNIVLDLGELDGIWAVTVTFLVADYCRDGKHAGRISVVAAASNVFEKLHRRGLAESVPIYRSVREATAPAGRDLQELHRPNRRDRLMGPAHPRPRLRKESLPQWLVGFELWAPLGQPN